MFVLLGSREDRAKNVSGTDRVAELTLGGGVQVSCYPHGRVMSTQEAA